MAQPKVLPATYADIEALPPHVVGQIAFGILHTHPRPTPRHSVASSALGGTLWSPFQRGIGGPGGWLFMDEPELHLGPHILVPDMAGWRRERMPRLPETAFVETTPDWICEVLSPSTARFDRPEKLDIYATFGVRHALYVDPNLRTLEVFELKDARWTIAAVFKDADFVTAPPFQACTFPLNVLWPDQDTNTSI